MVMMTLAHRMQVFGVIHHAGLQRERSELRWDAVASKSDGQPLYRMPMPYLSGTSGKGRLEFVFVHPIWGPAIVTVELVFIFTSEWYGIDEKRCGLDRIPVKTDSTLEFTQLAF